MNISELIKGWKRAKEKPAKPTTNSYVKTDEETLEYLKKAYGGVSGGTAAISTSTIGPGSFTYGTSPATAYISTRLRPFTPPEKVCLVRHRTTRISIAALLDNNWYDFFSGQQIVDPHITVLETIDLQKLLHTARLELGQ